MVKTVQKSYPELVVRFPRNLVHVCSIGDSSPSYFDKMMTLSPDDLDLFYSKVNLGNMVFYMGKGGNNGYFGHCCSLRDLKVVRCRQLIESMEV